MLVVVLAGAVWLKWGELRAWYLLWRDFASLGSNAQGYPECRHRQTGIVFVKLPGGEFWMGAQREDPDGQNYDPLARKDEGPVHKVFLSPFLIAKFEICQAEWERVMDDNTPRLKGDNLPVEQVWEESQEFCRKTGLSLPSEAQWEYACRAGSTEAFCFGDDASCLGDYAWYKKNAGRKPHPVGEKRPNAFGLYDMHGNVWEWCEDIFDSEFYSKPKATRTDPLCTSGSRLRVIRGGSWNNDVPLSHETSREPWRLPNLWSVMPGLCHSAFRSAAPPSTAPGFPVFAHATPSADRPPSARWPRRLDAPVKKTPGDRSPGAGSTHRRSTRDPQIVPAMRALHTGTFR